MFYSKGALHALHVAVPSLAIEICTPEKVSLSVASKERACLPGRLSSEAKSPYGRIETSLHMAIIPSTHTRTGPSGSNDAKGPLSCHLTAD